MATVPQDYAVAGVPTASRSTSRRFAGSATTGGSPLLAAALRYAARGWRVFPLHSLTKQDACTCGKSDCANVAKHPRTTHGLMDGTTNPTRLQQWWRVWPQANIGIVTGPASGLLVLDVDPRHDGEDALRELEARYGPLPVTAVAQTGGGGWHYLFAHPCDARAQRNATNLDNLPGLDVRADGGYIVAAPSLHRERTRYRWTQTSATHTALTQGVLAPAPEWLIELLAPTATWRRTKTNCAATTTIGAHHNATGNATGNRGDYWLDRALQRASPGVRDHTGLWLAQQLVWNEVANAESVMLAYAAAAPQGEHPYSPRDALRNLDSAQRQAKRPPAQGQGRLMRFPSSVAAQEVAAQVATRTADSDQPVQRLDRQVDQRWQDGGGAAPPTIQAERGEHEDQAPRDYHLTELGNAERLLDRHGENIRYNKALGFLVWDGNRWAPGSDLVVQTWAKATVRALYREAADLALRAARCDDSAEREQLVKRSQDLLKWAKTSESNRVVTNMLNLVRDDCYLAPDAFDAHPWLFNCANGTLDLRSGALRSPRREDYLIQRSPIAYQPHATAPTFLRFLGEILLDREPLVRYMQKTLGYALSGSVEEQVWHLLVGEGENGKSTLMDLIEYVLGDYAGTMEPESLTIQRTARDGASATPDIAALQGKRFIKVTETEQGAQLAPARIKKLSGGDRLTGRFLHKDIFSFAPTMKLFIYTNHRPQARETTHAFWRRVRYIPFDFSLATAPHKKDTGLMAKLRAEAEGVLAWLVAGCLLWQQEGLAAPDEVRAATAAYREENDLVGQFLQARCVLAPAEQRQQISVQAERLYQAYEAWVEATGGRAYAYQRFRQAITEKGFESGHTRLGTYWYGLRLRTETEDAAQAVEAAAGVVVDPSTTAQAAAQAAIASVRDNALSHTPVSVTAPQVDTHSANPENTTAMPSVRDSVTACDSISQKLPYGTLHRGVTTNTCHMLSHRHTEEEKREEERGTKTDEISDSSDHAENSVDPPTRDTRRHNAVTGRHALSHSVASGATPPATTPTNPLQAQQAQPYLPWRVGQLVRQGMAENKAIRQAIDEQRTGRMVPLLPDQPAATNNQDRNQDRQFGDNT